MIRALREWMFKTWYWYVNNIDKNAEILFMNYGYSNSGMPVPLEDIDEKNRYSIQLYHLLASSVDLRNKDIAEIGSGRGGGLSYVVRNFQPTSALGIDLDKHAARFCSRHYRLPGLSFAQGDAQHLPFLKNESFDAIVNVESSHRYPRMDLFLNEVHRLLRPGGLFLYADFRYTHEMNALKQHLADSGLSIVREEIITESVVQALNADDQRKRLLITKLAPRFIHKMAYNFAGTIGSDTYERFKLHTYEYFFYVMKK